jgi:hypothetical protein
MDFLVDEDYLEYKNNLTAKRSLEKKLPTSKGRTASPNHTNSNAAASCGMPFFIHENYLEYKSDLAAKRSLEKKLPRSKGRAAPPK